MSLANKYRPQTFDQMIGQEHIIDILKAQMEARETVHHNYLLFGPRGTGKTTSARLIAKGLNCLDLQHGNPCNQCSNCQLINDARSLDYVEIDAASHTGVDTIREEIIDKALYPPTSLRKKIYVIDEVHMLSKGAFNALLKTIEEPKSNVCFILATTEIHKVPDTIISRCQVFNYRKVAVAPMVAHLETICAAEGLTASQEALRIIARLAEWHVRDAVKYIDQVSILWAITEENITKFLGVAGEAKIQELLDALKSGEKSQIFALLDALSQGGVDLTVFAKQVIAYIDEHLLEDMDFLLGLCKVFGEIISMLRWYPYPLIAYKLAFTDYLQLEKVETSQSPSPLVASGANISHPSGACSWSSMSSVQQPISQQLESAAVGVVEHSIGDVSVQSAGWDQAVSVSIDSASVQEVDFKALWQQVIAQINKPTVQTNLKDQAIIEAQVGNVVQITVITKIAEMLLKNEENRKMIESLLSTALGLSVQIEVRYEDKASYFARTMGI